MGFNNKGVLAAVNNLKKAHKVLVGCKIGKNKLTPNNLAGAEYLICCEAQFDHVDYFVVNVSSPNTHGLRELQYREPWRALLGDLKRENSKLAGERGIKERPILLKIAPDLTDDQLLDIIGIVKDTAIDGVIATNTTIARDHLKSDGALQKE